MTNSITHSDEINYNRLDVAPPDTQIATGPTANVEVVNDMGTYTLRNQAPIQTKFDLNVFFGVPINFIFTDPKIVYDAASGHWYMSGASFDAKNDGYVYLAVSRTTDPTGMWWIYTILNQSTSAVFCDQPRLGFSSDNIVVACDDFGINGSFDPGYMMIGKAGAIAGKPYEYVRFFGPNDGGKHLNLQPVYSMTSSNAAFIHPPIPVEYLVYHNGFGVGVLGVWGNVANQSVGWGESLDQLNTAPQTAPPAAAEQGSTTRIDSGDMRILSAVFRNNIIWLTSGDTCTPAGDTAQHACMRLNQVDVTNFPHPRLTQDYDVATVGADLIYPAITMDTSGTAYLAYTATSATTWPEFDIADILPAIPGQVDQAFQIVPGFGTYVGATFGQGGPYRWGDYSAAAPDPNDPHGVILAGEYADAPNQNSWGTEGGLFRIAPCLTANLTAQSAGPVYPGPSVTFTASSFGCWGAPQYRFWEQPPGGAWRIVQDYSSASTWVWDTSKETLLGVYKFELDARSHGFLTAYDTVSQTLFGLASPGTCPDTVTFSPASPAPTGSVVQISASSTCPDPIYKFWIKPPGGAWSVVQNYGPARTFNWNGSGVAGAYGVEVDVKDRLDPGSFYGFPTNLSYSLQACTGAALTATPPSPSTPGTAIQLSASASCLGTPAYRFWVRPPGGAWAINQNWGPSATISWQTAGLAQGTYSLEVDVKNQGVASYETVANINYLLSTPTLCGPILTANPTSGATGAGTTFTATSVSCPNPRFRFWIQPPGGAWKIVQDYSNGSGTFSWSGAATPGLYHFEVDSRDVSESVAYDAVATMAYPVRGCSAVAISGNPASPQLPGGTIVVSGAPTCPGTAAYRFWVRAPGGPWTLKHDYSASATFDWTTGGLAIGTYGLEVDVRDQGASSSYEATANTTYILGQPCATPTLTANPASPVASGSVVVLTATTSGCPSPQYRFWLRQPGGTWFTGGYGTLSTYTVSAINAGTASFEVDVKDASETTVSYDAVATITYPLVGCNAATLTASPMSAPQGSVINFVATANCPYGGRPEFRFWVKAGGSWHVVEDYPIGVSNYMLSTTGLPHGTYYVEVDVRNKGTNVSYETVANIAYVL